MAERSAAGAESSTDGAESSRPSVSHSEASLSSRSRDRDRRESRRGESRRSRDRPQARDGRRSRSRDRSRGRERDRSRSRSRSRDRHYRRDRRRSRSRSRDRPSPRDYRRRDRMRDRSRSRDRPPPRDYRRRERGLSPATLRARAERKEDEAKPKRIWDGFQWIEPLASDAAQASTAAGSAHTVVTTSQQTRQERRLHVGNLPPECTAEQLTEFLNTCMDTCLTGAGAALPDQFQHAVQAVWLGPTAKYAFVEFVTKECAAIALNLAGITFQGSPLRISRPNSYTSGQIMGSAAPNHAVANLMLAGGAGGGASNALLTSDQVLQMAQANPDLLTTMGVGLPGLPTSTSTSTPSAP